LTTSKDVGFGPTVTVEGLLSGLGAKGTLILARIIALADGRAK
jgi:hypothetical protein